MRVHVLLSLALASLFHSCKKEDVKSPAPKEDVITNRVTMDFTNYVGNKQLQLSSKVYTNQDGDDFQVTKFNYFISNIRLKNADGNEYVHKGYYLLSEDNEASLSIDMDDIPDGIYKSVTFMIGVDSITNAYALNSGQLKSTDEMYMSANAGYIMLNMEGTSPASKHPDNVLKYHIGGATGPTNVVKLISLAFPQDLEVKADHKHIRITTDLLKMFGPDYVVDFSTLGAIYAPGDNASVIAYNYKKMFSISGVGE